MMTHGAGRGKYDPTSGGFVGAAGRDSLSVDANRREVAG